MKATDAREANSYEPGKIFDHVRYDVIDVSCELHEILQPTWLDIPPYDVAP